MSEHIVDTMLEVAMLIDTAQHANAARATDSSFLVAGKLVRIYRRDRIEKTDDSVMIARYLKELDGELASIKGPAEDAISEARRLINDLRQSLLVEMYTYTTLTLDGTLPSNRWGTREAIVARFGSNPDVKIVDAMPVIVDEKDFCLDWPGFARKGFTP